MQANLCRSTVENLTPFRNEPESVQEVLSGLYFAKEASNQAARSKAATKLQ